MTELIEIAGIIGLYRIIIYALGDTHKEFNAQAILAEITYEIATIRLVQVKEPLQLIDYNDKTMNGLINKRTIMTYTVEQARLAGGWVNVLGFCPVCTSFWVLLVAVLPFYGWAWFGISLILTKITIQWT